MIPEEGKPGEPPLRLLHLVGDGDRSGLFTRLIEAHDRDRVRPRLATVGSCEPALREAMARLDVPVLSLDGSPPWGGAGAVTRLVGHLRRERIQVLNTHLYHPSVAGQAAGALARTPIRVVTRHHSDYHLRAGRSVHVALDRFTTTLVHRVVAVSEHTRQVLIHREGAPPEKVVTVLNSVDRQRVRVALEADPSELRRRLPVGPGELALVVPARLHPEKGHSTLFRALRLLDSRRVGVAWASLRPKYRVFLLGDGPSRKAYEEEVASLGLAGRVVFMGSRPDAVELMRAADGVVLPSHAEAFGLVVLEALAVGAPLVATTAGGIPELVRHEENALLVPPEDEWTLARALARVLDEPGLRERLAAAGGPKVLEPYTAERMAREYEEVYLDAARERGLRV